MVNEDAALLNRHVTHMTPPHFSAAVYTGTFNFTITATDSSGCTIAQAYSVTMNCPTITVTPATLPDGVTNVTYPSQTMVSSGGTSPYIYAISSGSLPGGLTLSSAGALSGTPTNGGTFSFTVQSTDKYGCQGSTAYTVFIGAAPTISSSPTNQTVCAGSTAPFYVTATSNDGSTLAYAWRKNGTGWGAGKGWTISGTGANNGTFSSTSGTGTQIGANACWQLWSVNGGSQTAYRPLVSTLANSQSISLDMQVINIGVGTAGTQTGIPFTSDMNGFTLTDGSGNVYFGFQFVGGQSDFTIYDNSSNTHDTTIPYNSTGVRVTFTLLNSTNYSCQVKALASGTTALITGTLKSGPSGGIQRIYLYSNNGGNNGDVWFNNLSVQGATDFGSNYTSAQWITTANKGQSPLTDGATGNGGSYSGSATTNFSVTSPASGDAGTYSCVVMDSKGYSATSSSATLTVNSLPTITNSPTLAGATLGTAYSVTLGATAGTSPYAYALASGNLPGGVTLTTNGVISGTPTNANTFNFSVQVTDSSSTGCSSTSNLTITASCPAITVAPSILPTINIGTPYSQTVTASGGTSPYTYAITSGSLPSGLTMDTNSGVVSGTYSGSSGTASFTVTATDAYGCAGSTAYSPAMLTCPTITLSPGTLSDATVSSFYTNHISSSGGTGPYTYTVNIGSLPPGLTLGSSGALSGTPTATGSSSFTILATDTATGCTGSQGYTLNVICPTLSMTPAAGSLNSGTVAAAYTTNFSASGGVGTYTYTNTAGSLPPGLTLSSGGSLTGTPTNAGTFSLTVTATDTKGCTIAQAYSATINCPTITLSSTNLPFGISNATYSVVGNTITANGGTAPYTYAVTSGSLPGGLTITANGVISGTPTNVSSTFTVTATDKYNCSGSQAYTITVGQPVAITTQPVNTTSCANSTAALSVVNSGSTPVSYAWRKQGTGWGTGNAWTFTGSGNHGNYIGDATGCGGDINPGINSSGTSKALGIWANGDGQSEATRNFGALQIGQSVALDYQNPRDMLTNGNGSQALLALRDSTGTARFEFYFIGGNTQYTINDSNALPNSSGIVYTKSGLHLVFTLVTADTYNLQVTRLDTGTNYTYVGRTLNGTSGNSISQVRFWMKNGNGGGTACQDFFFNEIVAGGYSDGAGNYTAGTSDWITTANRGQGPLSNGGSISGADTNTLLVASVSSNAVTYSVVVYNAYGSLRSTTATLATNPAPVANTANYTRPNNLSLKIAITNLMTNATISGGHTLVLSSVGSSTNGAVVIDDGTYVKYSNTNNVNDSFTYTVTDSNTGCASTGTVLVQVVGGQTGQTNVTAVVTSTNATVTYFGVAGYQYVAQRSTNLTPGVGLGWVNISTNNATNSGPFQVIDSFQDLGITVPPIPSPAFYRLMTP